MATLSFLWLIRLNCILLRAQNNNARGPAAGGTSLLSVIHNIWIAPAPHSSWAFSTIREKALEKGNFYRRRKSTLSSLKAKQFWHMSCVGDEIKSFLVSANVYCDREDSFESNASYQRCGELLSLSQFIGGPKCEAWEYLRRRESSFEMRYLESKFDTDENAFTSFTRTLHGVDKAKENSIRRHFLRRRFAVMAGRRESLFRFGDADKDEGEWMRRRLIEDICVPLATRRYETIATCQTDRFDYSSPTCAEFSIAASIRIR